MNQNSTEKKHENDVIDLPIQYQYDADYKYCTELVQYLLQVTNVFHP